MRNISAGPAILRGGPAGRLRSLGDQDLSPVTVRDYLHNLARFRIWIEPRRRGQWREIAAAPDHGPTHPLPAALARRRTTESRHHQPQAPGAQKAVQLLNTHIIPIGMYDSSIC
jgi:hypothetical protein